MRLTLCFLVAALALGCACGGDATVGDGSDARIDTSVGGTGGAKDSGTDADAPSISDGPKSTVAKRHRATVDVCFQDRPAGLNFDAGASCPYYCCNDLECSDAGANGRCTQLFMVCCPDMATTCTWDECFSDDDCPAMTVCDCRESLIHTDPSSQNRCLLFGNCRLDSDCGASSYCSPSLDVNCGSAMGFRGYFCHTPNDACMNDEDCERGPSGQAGYCAFDQLAQSWVCSSRVCYDG